MMYSIDKNDINTILVTLRFLPALFALIQP